MTGEIILARAAPTREACYKLLCCCLAGRADRDKGKM
jgi:hypothetical protein